jgi:hypothetical protein
MTELLHPIPNHHTDILFLDPVLRGDGMNLVEGDGETHVRHAASTQRTGTVLHNLSA